MGTALADVRHGRPAPHGRAWRPVVGWALALVAVAALGGLGSDTSSAWYRQLDLPAFQPPGPAFGIVWPILYVLIAVAAVLAWRAAPDARERRTTAGWFAANLVLNVGWTWIFFTARQPLLAGLEILVLLATIVVLIARLRRTRPLAAGLLVPYLAWVSFATVLTWTIVALNA